MQRVEPHRPFARKGAEDGESIFMHAGDVGIEEGQELGEEDVEREGLDVVGGAMPLGGRKVDDDDEQRAVVGHGSEDEFKRSGEQSIFDPNPNPEDVSATIARRFPN